MNKNISVWRGSNPPPTKYHLWIQDDNSIYLHNGTEWDPIVDQDAFENLKDYLEHEEHSPKINLTSTIPDDSNLNDKEFKLFNVTGDLSITSPAKFGRDENFIALDGDIYLQGKIKGEADPLVSEVNPCLTGSFADKKVNIVFKKGDYEIGVNEDGYVRTVHRLTEPTWEILRTYGEFYKIKHIKTGKYLFYSDGIYTLSTGYTLFLFISKNSSIRSFEILRDGSSQCINMKSGSGWNYDISEWTKGNTNNELFVIDPSTFALPKITPMLRSKEPYEYKINFIQDKSYYFGGNESYNGASVLVKPEEKAYKFTFLGTYDNLTITRNELGNETTPPYCLKMDDVLVCGYSKGVFQLRPYGYESNQQFILIPLGYELALNPFRGISENNVIKTYNRNDVNNTVRFIPCEKNWVINRIISTQCATDVHDGLMSASDKAKLDLFQAASNYKTKQTAKSSPSASSSTYQFIDTISQDTNGVITATKKSVREATTSLSGLMTSSDKVKLNTLDTNVSDLTSKVNKLSWSVLKLEILADIQNLDNFQTKDGLPILYIGNELRLRITGTPDEVIYYCGSRGVDIQRLGNLFTITQRSVDPGTIVLILFAHPEDISISTYVSFIASVPGYDL